MQFGMILAVAVVSVVLTIGGVWADTPANCTYQDIQGLWVFHEGSRGHDKTVNCSDKVNVTNAFYVRLDFPNLATDFDGNVGYWTIIYNQGFEVVINNRKYFAFSLFKQSGDNVTSYCDHTFWGWAHETGVNPSDWSCYIGARADEQMIPAKSYKIKKQKLVFEKFVESQLYSTDFDYIDRINKVQSSWKATHYDFLQNMPISDLVKMAGGKKSRIINKPKPAQVSDELKKIADRLPESFDWRDVDGKSFVSPVRNQGSCGSCYAFAAMGMNEARLRIKTQMSSQSIFSPQDIVECSEYSQGCDGGFPYLIGGKYAEDFGLAEESCNPYTGRDGKCKTDKSCKRHYSTRYHYVGGFYGACNEAIMKIELVKNGPLVVAFEVYDDFFNYAGGIYHHTFQRDRKNFGEFNPFELTNHAVLLVGYGHDNQTNQDFWIVKNSWGTSWGEKGFFRIRRGNDECAIESIAVGSDIVV